MRYDEVFSFLPRLFRDEARPTPVKDVVAGS
jgi:hypothetical protein